MKKLSFGQYYQAKSFVHSMDSRAKILLLIAYFVAIFLVSNFWGFAVAGAFMLLAILFARVPVISVLKSVKSILFLVLFTVILNLFFYSGEYKVIYWQVGDFIQITDSSVMFSAFMALRLTMLVMGSSLLTLTTTPVEVGEGFKPTAHIEIDSTKVDAEKLAAIEAVLYGSESEEAKLPLPSELITLLGE